MTTPPTPPGDQNPAAYGGPDPRYQQAPNAYGQIPPVAQPPKRSRKWLWILLGAAGLLVVCCGFIVLRVTGGDDKDGQGGQGGQGKAPTTQGTTPGLGDPVRDGKFEFVAKKVECGIGSVGTSSAGKQAQGQFCLVTLSAKNISDKPQTLIDSNQKGIGTNGSEYNADSSAGLYANSSNSQIWVTEINPGNQVTGVIVYDLPKDVELAQLELHDSALSNGVRVDLK